MDKLKKKRFAKQKLKITVASFVEHCHHMKTVRMRENTDQKNSEYGHFLRSVLLQRSKWNKKLAGQKIIDHQDLEEAIPEA